MYIRIHFSSSLQIALYSKPYFQMHSMEISLEFRIKCRIWLECEWLSNKPAKNGFPHRPMSNEPPCTKWLDGQKDYKGIQSPTSCSEIKTEFFPRNLKH